MALFSIFLFMKQYTFRQRIIIFICCLLSGFSISFACTSAIISADASASGRPMLWKHRDTSNTDNKVEYISGEDGEFSFVALFNADDRECKEAWIGMNEVGFAVMNTASYNIKNDNVPASKMDKEGLLMAMALKACTTVEDFENFLINLPKPMGVEANFGVIDAYGNGAFYETNNDSFVKFDLKQSPNGVLIRTNYSHSGRAGEGYGYVREANAEHLLLPYLGNASVTPELLTEYLSRSFYHDVKKCDVIQDERGKWMVDEDFIPRYKSTATVVIEGIIPLQAGADIDRNSDIISQYIMWTGLGYPPCAEIYPVWCHPQGVDEGLRGIAFKGRSPLCNKAKMRRDEVFSYPLGKGKKGKSNKYINKEILINSAGTGYIQTIVPSNIATYSLIKHRRDNNEIRF